MTDEISTSSRTVPPAGSLSACSRWRVPALSAAWFWASSVAPTPSRCAPKPGRGHVAARR